MKRFSGRIQTLIDEIVIGGLSNLTAQTGILWYFHPDFDVPWYSSKIHFKTCMGCSTIPTGGVEEYSRPSPCMLQDKPCPTSICNNPSLPSTLEVRKHCIHMTRTSLSAVQRSSMHTARRGTGRCINAMQERLCHGMTVSCVVQHSCWSF